MLGEFMSGSQMPKPDEVRGIVFFPQPQIGDAIHATVVCRWLKAAYPGARLTVVAKGASLGLYRRCPAIDEVIDRPGGPKWNLWRTLRQTRADLAISCYSSHSMLLWSSLAGIRHRAWPTVRKYQRLVTITGETWRPGENDVTGLAARWLAPLADVNDKTPLLLSTEEDRKEAEAALVSVGMAGRSDLVAIMVGSSHPHKEWDLDRFVQVWEALSAQGFTPILLGGPDEAEKIKGLPSSPPSLAGKLSVAATLPLLAQCRLLITNDTGLAHCAGAVGCPVVSLYGPGFPDRFFPPGDRHTLILGDCPCQPRVLEACTRQCQRAITVDQVLAAASGWLAENR